MDEPNVAADIRVCALCAKQPAFYVWSPISAQSQLIVSGACVEHVEYVEDMHDAKFGQSIRWPSFEFEG